MKKQHSLTYDESKIFAPTPQNLKRAVRLLMADQICAFPTETVYGLGGNALSASAIEKIYRLKGRPASNPLIVHVRDLDHAKEIASEIPDEAYDLAKQFWPGPLTLVLNKASHVPQQVTAGRATVAIRVPSHPIAQRLLHDSGLALCAPSANRSEHLSPTRADHVLHSLPLVPMILDGGPCEFGLESTIVDMTARFPTILRPGALSFEQLRQVLVTLQRPMELQISNSPIAPGMFRRHYAPDVELILTETIHQNQILSLPGPVGVILLNPLPCLKAHSIQVLGDDPVVYAAALFSTLHHFEDIQIRTILVQIPPPETAWDAVRDRLLRASVNAD